MSEADEFARTLPKFKAWLQAQGAQILAPTNEWEMLRYRGNEETHVIYRNKGGRLRFVPGGARCALIAFENNKPWEMRPKPTKRKRVSPYIKAVMQRDGVECFYCLQKVLGEDASIDHLVPVAHGGPNHLSNFVLAHTACNQKAGHLSVKEKINMHVAARIAAIAQENPPWV